MPTFTYINNKLHADKVNVEDIAKEMGTPFYCYSKPAIERNFLAFKDSFTRLKPLVCYAVKANPNLSILKLLRELDAGADCVSGGEVLRALTAGISPKKIVFSGVGKTEEELKFALESGILQFNVESIEELKLLSKVAQQLKMTARVAFRVNPDIDCQSNSKISTGKKDNKFGITKDTILEAYETASQLPNIEVKGISTHIGSQITSIAPFQLMFKEMKRLIGDIAKKGFNITTLDLGGGIGVRYNNDEQTINLSAYAAQLEETFKDFEGQIILEPGRLIVADAGILVSKVLYIKQSEDRKFAVIDAGMNDFIRPALYDSTHKISPVSLSMKPLYNYYVVGPVCESSDIFSNEAALPALEANDLIAVGKAGAYGFSMASNYNSRPFITEVLTENDSFRVIRSRQTLEEMLALERKCLQ